LIGQTGAVAEEQSTGRKTRHYREQTWRGRKKLGPYLRQGKVKTPLGWRKWLRNDRLPLAGKTSAAGEKIRVGRPATTKRMSCVRNPERVNE
jgi:hypothetical protein